MIVADLSKQNRHSIRLKGYDYSLPGGYFITICVIKGEFLLGEIKNGDSILSDIGEIVDKYWLSLPTRFPMAILDKYAIMPNHFHGILIIDDHRRGEVPSPSLTNPLFDKTKLNKSGGGTPPLQEMPTLGQMIAFFKYKSTKEINLLIRIIPGPFWQRNYYEHIIRNEDDLHQTRKYIMENPLKWDTDEYNPQNIL
jgi:putative transposase